MSEFCPISFKSENDKLHIAAQQVQRINIWQPGRQSPVMRYDSRSFTGFQVRQGECILELILYPSAGTIQIHMTLSNPERSVESTFEEKEPVKQQITSNVDSSSTITGLQEQLNPTPEKKSNRPKIQPPHQEEQTSSVQQEPIEPQTTVGSEPSSNHAETSSEQFHQIEAIVDGLLSRLDAVDKVVDALIEQQKSHNEKQTKLAEDIDIEAVVPNLQSMLSQQ